MSTYSYGIDFFDDATLETEINTLLARASKKVDPHKNVVDPFAILFQAAIADSKISDWQGLEIARQSNKSLTNALGDFHQTMLGKLPGWESTGASGGLVDLKHPTPFGMRQTPALAEVKNKFNTMNSSGQLKQFETFQDILRIPEYKSYTCYLIQVIQQAPHDDIPWKIPGRGEQENIRIISAPRVYALSTGDSRAFPKFLRAVLQVLEQRHGLTFDGEDEHALADLLGRIPGFS